MREVQSINKKKKCILFEFVSRETKGCVRPLFPLTIQLVLICHSILLRETQETTYFV